MVQRLFALFVIANGVAQIRAMDTMQSSPNPIRKVVNLLQEMIVKINNEAKIEKDLYDKFMCYCKTQLKEFEKAKAAFEAAIPRLQGDISTTEAAITQLEGEIQANKADQSEATAAVDSATAQRTKEREAALKVLVRRRRI